VSDLVARLRIEANAAQLVAETGRAERSIAGVERAAVGLGRAGATAAQGLNQTTAAARGAERAVSGMGAVAAGVGGLLAGIGLRELTGDIKDAAIAASGFELGLSSVAGGASGARAELAFVRAEALRLGLDLRNATGDYLGLTAATNGTSLAGQQTREIWLGVAEAGLAMGRSNEQVGRGLTAIQQIASKGVVSMEEIRQQLAEAIPGASNISARALGMTTGEFNKLVESGKLTSEVFLPKFAAQLRSEFGPAIERYLVSDIGRARQELGQLSTSIFDLQAAAGREFLGGLLDGLGGLNDTLGDGETVANVRELARELGELAGVGAAGIGVVVEHADLLAAAAGGLVAIGLARWMVGVGTAAIGAATAVRVETAATVAGAEAALAKAWAVGQGMRMEEGYAARMIAVAAAERQLTAARAASASGLLAGRAALGGVVTMLGGPYVLAITAAAAAIGGLMYLEQQREAQLREAAQAVDTHNAAMAEADRLLKEAGVHTAGWSTATAGAVGPTDQLAGSTKNLADQTFRLADARRQAGVEALNQSIAADRKELERIQKRRANVDMPGLVSVFGVGGPQRAEQLRDRATIQAPVGTNADGSVKMGAKRLDEYEAEVRARMGKAQFAALQLTMAPPAKPAAAPSNTATSSSKGSKSNRAGNMATDLQADIEALKEHRAALAAGGQALDEWSIKDAGRQAVERAGLTHKAALTSAEGGLAAAIRTSAEAAERMKIANERVDRAVGLQRQAEEDTAALQRRSAAVAIAGDALDDLRVHEAGLEAMRRIGIDTLDQLTGRDREVAEAAIAASQAKERQAISTEKAERAAGAIQDLEARIRAEQLRGQVIGKGVAAEVEYARAEAIRNEVERAGRDLTAEQTIAIIEKVDALFRVQAANDNASAVADLQDELRLLRMTRQERDLEERILRRTARLKADNRDLAEAELAARARAAALVEQGALENAAAIGQLREGLREAFIRDGRLAFDDLGDFATQRLRQAVYDALLAKPIDMIINAVVRGLPGGAGGMSLMSAPGLLGAGAVAASMIGGRGGRAAASGLGAASMGLSAGSALMGAATMGTLGSGALAGAAMSIAPMLGPIGIAIGVGLALKELLKGKPTNAGAGISLVTGQLSGDKRTSETEQAARGAADAITAGAKILADAGIKATATVHGLVVGTRDPSQVYLTNGQTVTAAVGDAGAAAEAGLKAMLASATYATEAQKKLVESMVAAGKGFDDIAAALEGYKAAQAISGQIDDAILQLTDPRAWGLEELKRAQKEQRDSLKAASDAGYLSAEDFAAASAKLTKLETLQLQAKLKELGDAAGDAADALGFQKSVQDRILELTNPTAYKVKRINDDHAARVAEAQPMIAAGLLDPQILGQLEQLRQLELGQLADEVNQTAKAFQDARPRLLAWIDQMRGGAAAELSPKAARAEALAQYQRELAKAQAGDPNSIANITGYADRLTEADKLATSSASARLALRNQLMADIGGLADRGAASASPAAAIAQLQIPLETIAQASAAQYAAIASGGQPVKIADLPSIQAMYANTLTIHTDRLIAANDQNTAEIVASVQAAQAAQASVLAQFGDAIGGAIGAALQAQADQSAQMAEALNELATETRLTDARARAGSR